MIDNAKVLVKKPILLSDLGNFEYIEKVIIESLEQALYSLVIEVDQQQYYVLESENKALTRRSIIAMQEVLSRYIVKSMYLQHKSPYDEMIGQEVNVNSNALLVPIGHYFEQPEGTVH